MSVDQRSLLEQLVAEAEERLGTTRPEEWGVEIQLAEGEKFLGRFVGEEIDPETDRPVFLLLAPDEGVTDLAKATVPVFIRERSVLRSEIDRVRPTPGDFVVIARGDDRQGKENAYHSYAVAVAPCSEPLPEATTKAGGVALGDDIPFAPATA